MDLTALIARLEASARPHREIDAEIFRTIGLTEEQESHCEEWCSMGGRTDLTRDRYIKAWAPAFTRSVDDALTLVPGDCTWVLGKWLSISGDGPPAYWFDIHGREEVTVRHPVAAIAISSAALKARAAQETSRG